MIKVLGNVNPQPEGSFGEQYAALVPQDATVTSYDPKRFSLVTGLVEDMTGSPIAGVTVCIHHRMQYGTAITDATGRFYIPTDGGDTITLTYDKVGLVATSRQVYVTWNGTAIAETVVMIAEDTASTTLTFDGDPTTVVTHKSTEITDVSGSRSCTTVFTGDNRAYLVDENGNDIEELTTITTRATEYTTPESMPAILPPRTAFTYCVELCVDGVKRVRFEKPVISWVDNFLGFDVGASAPVGYYDRDRGVWVASKNGYVIRLLDTDNDGIVDSLDADGDDLPDDITFDGTLDDEVTGLNDSQIYTPGATFWRFEVSHFSPWDVNWPSLRQGETLRPNPPSPPRINQNEGKTLRSCTQMNSFVDDRSRVFHEDIPIPGTDMTLHYASDNVDGYKTVITVPRSGGVPQGVVDIRTTVKIADITLEETVDPFYYKSTVFTWDGLNSEGKKVDTNKATVTIGFGYFENYLMDTETKTWTACGLGGCVSFDYAASPVDCLGGGGGGVGVRLQGRKHIIIIRLIT